MVKNIIIGALAGAAIAYLYSEKKSMRYGVMVDHANQFIHKMKRKMMHGMDKGKNRAQCMSSNASEYLHNMHR